MIDCAIDREIERVRTELAKVRSKNAAKEIAQVIKQEKSQRKMDFCRTAHGKLLKARGVTSCTQNNYVLYSHAVRESHKQKSIPTHILKLESTLCSMIHHIGNIHIQTTLINEQSYNTTKKYKRIAGNCAEEGARKEAEFLKKIVEETSKIEKMKEEFTKMKEEHAYELARMEWDKSLVSFGGSVLDEAFLTAVSMEPSIEQQVLYGKKPRKDLQERLESQGVLSSQMDEQRRRPCNTAA